MQNEAFIKNTSLSIAFNRATAKYWKKVTKEKKLEKK